MFQPDDTKHCKLCDVCIKDYDHHCLFLNQCIGRGNHRSFLLFILSMMTAHLLFIASATSYLYNNPASGSDDDDDDGGGGGGLSSWLSYLGEEFWVVALMVMNALTLLWEVWLLSEQFDAIATGTTTYFRHFDAPAGRRPLGQRWVTVLTFLLEGRRCVSRGPGGGDQTAIDI